MALKLSVLFYERIKNGSAGGIYGIIGCTSNGDMVLRHEHKVRSQELLIVMIVLWTLFNYVLSLLQLPSL